MICEGDSFVDGKPISNEIHKVLKHLFKVGVSRDGDGNVNTGSTRDNGVRITIPYKTVKYTHIPTQMKRGTF